METRLRYFILIIFMFPIYCFSNEATRIIELNPITATWTAGEWVVDKITSKKNTFHSSERQAKFDKWRKEDWIKDDPYSCMWDLNWIHSNDLRPKYNAC